MSTQDQTGRSATQVKATIPTPAYTNPVRARTYRSIQTTFLCQQQWADAINDFNLFQQKTRMFALKNLYRQFSVYSKTEITKGRNGFIENAFLGCAVKMCVGKAQPMTKRIKILFFLTENMTTNMMAYFSALWLLHYDQKLFIKGRASPERVAQLTEGSSHTAKRLWI